MKSKTTAGILAIVFGEWGIHCFYLGKTGKGLAYLLIWLLLCWTVWVPIILAIIAIIEGFALLFANQADFDAKYNNGRPVRTQMQYQSRQQYDTSQVIQNRQKDERQKNKTDMLIELKNLLDKGILTQEEFEEEKQKILNS